MKAEELKRTIVEAKTLFLQSANGIEISEALESGLISREEFEQLFNAAQKQTVDYTVLGSCMSALPNQFQEFAFTLLQAGNYMVRVSPYKVVLLRMR